MTGPGIEGF